MAKNLPPDQMTRRRALSLVLILIDSELERAGPVRSHRDRHSWPAELVAARAALADLKRSIRERRRKVES